MRLWNQTMGVARIFDWGGPKPQEKFSQSDLGLLIGGGAKCSWSSISDRGGGATHNLHSE